ncbi:tRNA lysidine(34) synthetase TilS [Candidatus Saccharibacteria bacterium RIFCSPHIGHO2_12_FULL_49_19]|nr:MAG: tRNA lysidine(34) synthetase TilS [Candidatus Saccharibacteria bacterium RIFCSPHIGHO2_01_FULL_49_21]OGL36150.1 MAG: tRNA lysidine(34) synthetase TilS [Candidatus Saccharibacteria bacterium RIFCSPHIGHO2_12_FULL_49_19]OGL38504.1 MAG: tRNA lysidine(34) synthetase TilS [Candidatus Saccharibacteria bacterium RIFCSPLOWO2_01_FULL_49_22]
MKEIKLSLPAGKYVLAVSGGVDSMTLLHLLAKSQKPKVKSQFVVAHFNHGIRPDSVEDEKLVLKMSIKYQLPFEVGYGKLGKIASEEQARKARYWFLDRIRHKYQADAIITAHHQDDLLETAVINILRGTRYRGLVAIAENPDILRPLLKFSKNDLLEYAKQHNLTWREDSSNVSEAYLRNYIRRRVLANLTDSQRKEFLNNIDKVAKISKAQNQLIATISHNIKKNDRINRLEFSSLPVEVANELLVYWLREIGFRSYNRKMIDRLNLAIRTASPGTRHRISKDLWLVMGRKEVAFSREQ